MEENFYDRTYDKVNFKEGAVKKGEYETCAFNNCDFSGTDLSEIQFIECSFLSCNLSLAKLNKTVFRDIRFTDCKMLGLFALTLALHSDCLSVLKTVLSVIQYFIRQRSGEQLLRILSSTKQILLKVI